MNGTELANAAVTARKINSPWFGKSDGIYGEKAVVYNPNRGAQPVTLSMTLKGAGRFDMVTSIRAELENSRTVFVESTENYIYEDNKFAWIVPSGFNVKDDGQMLKCTLSGLLDERTIHSCDFISANSTHWTGNAPVVSTDTRFGKYSIKNTESTDDNQYFTLTPPGALDLSEASHLRFWIKSNKASTWFNTLALQILTDSSYDGYDLTSFAANTWDCQGISLAFSSATVTNVTSIRILTNPPGASSYDIYLAWVWVT